MGSSVDVGARLAELEGRIRAAGERCGRDPADVVLVGIGKRQPLERLRAAAAAGLRIFGENRVQEAVEKSAELPVGIEWHLVGPLQSNKVKPAVRLFDAVHSLDRPKIARLLDREAQRQDRRLQGFIQVHIGAEPSKHGFAVDGLAEAVRPLAELEHLEIVGLMAIPPYEEDPERARGWFRELRELRDELAARPEWSGFRGWLSMGMSHDFEIAVEEGATHVRVGTALFGPRD